MLSYLGENLKYYRTKAGMSMTDLDRKSLVCVYTINKIQQNKSKYPRMSVIIKLADALDITVEELVNKRVS